jgi:hypothetical protein
MRGGSSRGTRTIGLAVVTLLAIALVLRERGRRSPARPVPPAAPTATAPARPPATQAEVPARTPPPATPEAAEAAPAADPADPELPKASWAAVDLEAVRTTMPDNLYWVMSSPTTDRDLIRWREEERDRWNIEYGKVLSNTATDEEIDAYYAYRQRISSDYIEFAGYLLTGYGDKLSQDDKALLKLAIELHAARLEEIPRKIEEAHERHKAHEAARRAWLEDQKAFAGDRDAR